MSIATVVTLGMSISGGLTAGTDFLPTLGYTISTAVVVSGPYCIEKRGAFSTGAVEYGAFSPGPEKRGAFTTGSEKTAANC